MLDVTVDPREVSMDPERLQRIDRHLSRYVDDGRLAGWQVLVRRRGHTVHSSVYGQRDREAGTAVEPDTIWRIYSMTKPVTAVAAMSLFEEGAFRLHDEVARYLPEFADMRVLVGGNVDQPKTVPATEPIRLWHLFTHTAGLTYAFTRSSLLDDIYAKAQTDPLVDETLNLEVMCKRWAALPLLFEPGTSWNYSVATDVLGRVLEVLTGQSLDDVFRERVFDPLGMTETRWHVEPTDARRLAALYAHNPESGLPVRYDVLGNQALEPPAMLSGGGGLLSTATDYARFTDMLVRRGEHENGRVLGPRTLALMTRNHLPGGRQLTELARGGFAETMYEGFGFGLGFSVLLDPAAAKLPASPGEFAWGGLASTAFWVSPADDLTVHFYTQLIPSATYPIRAELRQLVYSAITD